MGTRRKASLGRVEEGVAGYRRNRLARISRGRQRARGDAAVRVAGGGSPVSRRAVTPRAPTGSVRRESIPTWSSFSSRTLAVLSPSVPKRAPSSPASYASARAVTCSPAIATKHPTVKPMASSPSMGAYLASRTRRRNLYHSPLSKTARAPLTSRTSKSIRAYLSSRQFFKLISTPTSH